MFNSLKKKAVILTVFFTPLTMTSCSDSSAEVFNAILEFLLSMLGWNPGSEDIPDQNKGVVYDDDTQETNGLPASVDLSRYFPAIGDQGSYGTCVAWSTGYAMKTSLDAGLPSAFVKGTAPATITSSNTCSAVDLWHNIPNSGKSSGCNGSNFEPALDALIKNGCASIASVPFTNKKMTCDGVTGKGGTNKLSGYRVIAYNSELSGSKNDVLGMNAGNIKYYLAKGYPVLVGAQLGEYFMEGKQDVITYDTEGYNGQHAYHAMVVTGYSDAKKAFRLRNSWGPTWGDNGSIWVGYDFFFKQFMFGAWIAYNSAADAPAKNATSSVALKSTSSNDLAAHVYSDVENADGTRTLTYNIENAGSSTIGAEQDWSVVYMLFNAKNLNEKVILFHDAYTTDANADGSYDGIATDPAENYATNVDLGAGENVAKKLGGKKMKFTYSLPTEINGKPLNGNYYMILIANPFNSFSEKNFANNYCFVSGYNAIPLTIQDGKIMNMPTSLNDQRSIVSSAKPNEYTGDELLQMLAYQKSSGKLKKLVNAKSNARALRSTKKLKQIVK